MGFAIAEKIAPNILLLDEVHEAVDHDFRAIVEQRAHAILHEGGIVVAAGHDHGLLERFCGRALLLRDGTVAVDGAYEEVRQDYAG